MAPGSGPPWPASRKTVWWRSAPVGGKATQAPGAKWASAIGPALALGPEEFSPTAAGIGLAPLGAAEGETAAREPPSAARSDGASTKTAPTSSVRPATAAPGHQSRRTDG